MKKLVSVAAVLFAVTVGASALQAQAAPASDGAQLYSRSCASCHGTTGAPNAAMVRALGPIPDLSVASTLASVADSTISNAIVHGKGKMPRSRTQFTPEQLRALVAYVRSLGHGH